MAQKTVSIFPHIKKVNVVSEKLAACRNVVDELKEIYSDKFLTDVELKTKTNSFPAHKIVLCARSPVFKLMFSNDMSERNSDSIQMDDWEDEIVQQMLLFLYSDKLENLQWETASKLYYAADKYQIEKLKLICSSFLIDNLSTSRVTELLVLADTYSDTDLQRDVEDFILDHEGAVFCSNEWEKLMEANPQLALKTMLFKYRTKKKHFSKSDDSQVDNMVRQVKVEEGPRNCFLCDKPFSNPEVYKKHLVHRHMVWAKKEGLKHNEGASPSDAIRTSQKEDIPTQKDLADISSPVTVMPCEMCLDFIANYPKFYQHMLEQEAEKCFRCSNQSCLKTFTSPSMFKQHIQKHPQDWMHSCRSCRVAFINRDKLLKHESTTDHILKLAIETGRQIVLGKQDLY